MTRDGHRVRVLVVDDERPARAFLLTMLRRYENVEVVGEADGGARAVELILELRPDLALLDLHMPEVDGLGVVRMLPKRRTPLIAFVTAHDQHAIEAFELNAIDYLLKPVTPVRLGETIRRALERLEHADLAVGQTERVRTVAADYAGVVGTTPIRRIPVRRRNDIVFVPVDQLATAGADGELVRLTTAAGERFVITYRLKDLESRLDPAQFVRLSRGALVNVGHIGRVTPVPGGTYEILMTNGQQLETSRIRSRVLREQLLKL
jgi:two-component system, LytTR family, response regulator